MEAKPQQMVCLLLPVALINACSGLVKGGKDGGGKEQPGSRGNDGDSSPVGNADLQLAARMETGCEERGLRLARWAWSSQAQSGHRPVSVDCEELPFLLAVKILCKERSKSKRRWCTGNKRALL